MTDVQINHAVQPRRPSRLRASARWMVTFAGFPLGAVVGRAVAGPVDSTGAALVGGALTGAVLGAFQCCGCRPHTPACPLVDRGNRRRTVDRTRDRCDRRRLRHRSRFARRPGCRLRLGGRSGSGGGPAAPLGASRPAWPMFLAATWAAGWAITTSIGVRVEEQFTVFGSAGAIAVTALTAVLPLALDRRHGRRS